MGLHDRLKTSNGSTSATAELLTGAQPHETSTQRSAQDPYAELKTRIHHACIATLGAELFKRFSSRRAIFYSLDICDAKIE